MRFHIHRADGKVGSYVQPDPRRAQVLARRFDPERMYRSGPISIGEGIPLNLINPDEVCWIDVESTLPTPRFMLPDVERVVRLPGREQYEAILARQWPLWRKQAQQPRELGGMLEALFELSMRGGLTLYLHVHARISNFNIAQLLAPGPALTAEWPGQGTTYINPSAIIRARLYHSVNAPEYPEGYWCAQSEDI